MTSKLHPVAFMDALLEHAHHARSNVVGINVAHLQELRSALSDLSRFHIMGQRASAVARYGRTHAMILQAADAVLTRDNSIEDLAIAVQAQLQHQRNETGLPHRVWCKATIKKHLNNFHVMAELDSYS